MRYAPEEIKPYAQSSEDKTTQVEAMFDCIAPRYDLLNHALSCGVDKYWRHVAIKRLQAHSVSELLDVATGTGDFALLAMRKINPTHITAIDLSEEMMRVGRHKAAKAGYGETCITFQRANCNALSYADEAFDAITIAFGIRNFVQLENCLAELRRVLKQSGRLCILELSTPTNPILKLLFHVYSRLFIPLIGRFTSHDASAYQYLPTSIAAFPQGEVMARIFQEAGFRDVQFKRLTGGLCTLYEATK